MKNSKKANSSDFGGETPSDQSTPELTEPSEDEQEETVEDEDAERQRLAEELGFPPCQRARAQDDQRFELTPGSSNASKDEPDFTDRTGVCLVSVCTLNHLHFAKALIESYRRHHPGEQAVLMVADWDGEEPVNVEGAQIVSPRALGSDHFDYMALKYSAIDLCCALKPYAIKWTLANTTAAKLLYLDSDIYVFTPLERMLAALDDHNFVVTPHTLAPLPNPERFWERPSLGHLADAGVMNAGMFGIAANAEAARFVDTWLEMATLPGAFLDTQGGQMEQNSFNWITCFADGVKILRDPAYNVAYWNLHDRSLRHVRLDDEERPYSWTVEGEPLVAFHFSGFDPFQPYQVSKHDSRHSLYVLPSLATLFDAYRTKLLEHGAEKHSALEYGFDRLASGIPIDANMRRLFKEHESYFWRQASAWTPEGEAHYCEALLAPVPYVGSLIPILFHRIYRESGLLQTEFPNADLAPGELIKWISSVGVYEHGYSELFDRYRPVLPKAAGIDSLSEARRQLPSVFAKLAQPMSADRQELFERLRVSNADWLTDRIRQFEFETYYLSPMSIVRSIITDREDVRAAFPDPLYADAKEFTDWLREWATRESSLPPEVADVFSEKAEGKALARMFSYVNRNWVFMRSWPLAFVGHDRFEFVKSLLDVLRHAPEYDLDDIVTFLWTMDEAPWKGLPLTLELAFNACRKPSPLLREAQEDLLAPVLALDRRFGEALLDYRRFFSSPHHLDQERYARAFSEAQPATSVLIYEHLDAKWKSEGPQPLPSSDSASSVIGPVAPPRTSLPGRLSRKKRGVNLFGFFRSSIGLGHLSRGLAAALRAADIPVQENLLGNIAMDKDLKPADFLRTYDHRLDTNIFVSYPHLHDMLLRMYPDWVVKDARNITYLAWEQRDGSSYWPEIYRDYDQVWALSGFAASALAQYMERDVLTVPSVLELSTFPEPAGKEAVGLDPDIFTFLYVFDANSSIVRKNPEAAIEAFSRAFPRDERVELVLKVSNAHRLEHWNRLGRLIAKAAASPTRVRFLTEDLPRDGLLQLLSAADCYVSLHHAEGFGYTCAEAMAYGKPVIATAYSGNLEFMNEHNSYLVNSTETEVSLADGPFQRGSIWGDPCVDHAAELMRKAYLDPEHAKAIGRAARRSISENLSPESVAPIVAAALER